jgi:hypothetical protein
LGGEVGGTVRNAPIYIRPEDFPAYPWKGLAASAAFLGQIGMIHLPLRFGRDEFFSSQDGPGLVAGYRSEMRSRLQANSAVTWPHERGAEEIRPHGAGKKAVWFEPNLHFAIDAQAVYAQLPDHKLFGQLPTSDVVEVLFNGAIFLAIARIVEVPSLLDLGALVRDFLEMALGESEFWSRSRIIGPSPTHIDLYAIVAVPTTVDAGVPDRPTVDTDSTRVVHLLQTREDANAHFAQIFKEATWALPFFYALMKRCIRVDGSVMKLSKITNRLAGTLASHFQAPPVLRVFSRKPRRIRRLLAKMHVAVQRISAQRIEIDRDGRFLGKLLERLPTLRLVAPYFRGEATPVLTFDRGALLALMSYAGHEAMGSSVIQSNLGAAIVGALAGALMALLLN